MPDLPAQFDLSSPSVHRFRLVSHSIQKGSSGASGNLRVPIHDNWWQTGNGRDHGRQLCGHRHSPRFDGATDAGNHGTSSPVTRDERPRRPGIPPIATPNVEGELALKAGWPSMFRGYLHNEERYENAFREAGISRVTSPRVDEDGYFWFVGRADDVIKSAGHLIGPFEVESALMEHPAVAEVGVIGKPDRDGWRTRQGLRFVEAWIRTNRTTSDSN